MKISRIALLSLIFLVTMFFTSCGQGDESNDGMKSSEITPLTETQVSNFIYVLPEIIDFSEKFHSRMSEEEKESPEANERYFNALKESSVIRGSVTAHGFKSVDEMLSVYKNVLLEYTTIKRNLTNDAMIAGLYRTIQEYRSNYTALLGNSTTTKEEAEKLQKQLDDLKNDETRYQNILLVKKYEKELDRVSQDQK